VSFCLRDAAGAPIAWTLRRSRRAKRVRIVVRCGGVEVVAPRRTPRATIDAFVDEKRDWIRTRVAAWREREVRALPERFETGGRVLYQGDHLELVVEPAAVRWPEVSVGPTFRVRVPRRLDREGREAAARKAALHWLRERVRSDAQRLIDRWAPAVGARPRGLRIGNQKTLWGSCSGRGVISLNWRLVTAPEPILEYVVVHELCHLLEANHGPRFWALVSALLPDWRQRRAWLRDHGVALG
jgi:predicted metal-dependent hydrolase